MLFICIGSSGSSAKSCVPLFSTLQPKSATIHWYVDPYDDARTKYIILPTTDSYQWYFYPYDDARTESIIFPTTNSYNWYLYPGDDAITKSTILPKAKASLINVIDFYFMYFCAILLEPMSIRPWIEGDYLYQSAIN